MQWQQLIKRYSQNKLPHALLIDGEFSIDKFQFAKKFGQFLLCENKKNDQACGKCRACHWFSAGTHPDFLIIEPLEDEKQIKISVIRDLIERLQQSSQCGGYTVVIISPAEAMNIAASNALLKILEEPNGNILFLLVSEQKFLLPATIRSRCQNIHFPYQKKDLTQLIDPKKLSVKHELDEIVVNLMEWVKIKINEDLNNKKKVMHWFNYLDRLFKVRGLILQKINLNKNLVIDSLLGEFLCLSTPTAI